MSTPAEKTKVGTQDAAAADAKKVEETKTEETKTEETKTEETKTEEIATEDVKIEDAGDSAADECDAMDCVVVEVAQGGVKLNVLVNLSSPTLAFSMEQLGDLCAAMKVLRAGTA